MALAHRRTLQLALHSTLYLDDRAVQSSILRREDRVTECSRSILVQYQYVHTGGSVLHHSPLFRQEYDGGRRKDGALEATVQLY